MTRRNADTLGNSVHAAERHDIRAWIVPLDAAAARPRLERIQLIAQAQRKGQIRRQLPAVPHVPRQLVVVRGHDLLLGGPPHGFGQAQQVRRIGIVLRQRGAGSGCDALREKQSALRSAISASVRRIFIEHVAHRFKSEADVVSRPGEGEIVVRRERHVVHEERPRIGIAQLIGIARDADNRSAALADILAVRARDTETLASHIGPVAEPRHGLPLPSPPE
jgi:hypothetical protein